MDPTCCSMLAARAHPPRPGCGLQAHSWPLAAGLLPGEERPQGPHVAVLSQLPDVGVLRADVDPETNGHVCTLSLRRALRRTFPASSRTGSETHSKLRGTL